MRAMSNWLAKVLGHPAAFVVASVLLAASVAIAILLRFNEAYMLGLTLVLSILAILLLFPIQYGQNRDGAALQAKLDEIIKALPKADNRMRGIEKE